MTPPLREDDGFRDRLEDTRSARKDTALDFEHDREDDRRGAAWELEAEELDFGRVLRWHGDGGGWGNREDARHARDPLRYEVAEASRRLAGLERETDDVKYATVGNEVKRTRDTRSCSRRWCSYPSAAWRRWNWGRSCRWCRWHWA